MIRNIEAVIYEFLRKLTRNLIAMREVAIPGSKYYRKYGWVFVLSAARKPKIHCTAFGHVKFELIYCHPDQRLVLKNHAAKTACPNLQYLRTTRIKVNCLIVISRVSRRGGSSLGRSWWSSFGHKPYHNCKLFLYLTCHLPCCVNCLAYLDLVNY